MPPVARRLSGLVLLAGAAAGCGQHPATGPFSGGGGAAGVQSGTATTGSLSTTAPGVTPAPPPASSPPPAPSPAPAPAPAGPRFEVAGWVPYWTYAVADGQVAANVGTALDEVNLFGYSLQADGSIVASRGIEDPARIAAIRSRGGRVITTLFDVNVTTALGQVLADPARQQRTIQGVLDAIDRNGLDGIDLDLEHATSSTRDAFSRFVADIGRAVKGRGKLFSVTVPPKRSDLPNWAGYDYAALGAAADRVKIMGYGVTGAWSAAGPTGPLNWLGQVVAYAKSVIPARKLQLGIPLYGLDWDAGGGVRSITTWTALQAKLRLSSGGARFDPTSADSTFEYVDAQGLRHTVWFTEPRGVALKAQLVRDQGLLGMTLWALGYGDQAHLDALESVLHP